MQLLLFIIFIVLLLALLLFAIASRIIFSFNSDRSDINLTVLWLYPFLKAIVTNEETKLVLNIYLFKKKLYQKILKPGHVKSNNLDLIKQVKPTDVNINASYGFRDPFLTGVACGAISIASQFINIDSINQNPDFVADNDYIYLDATAKVNLGSAILNLYRAQKGSAEK